MPKPLRASRGRLAAGSIVSGLRVERPGASRAVLVVTTTRRARLVVRVTGRRRALQARSKRCGSVRFALPSSHGRARLSASVRQGTERRTIVY